MEPALIAALAVLVALLIAGATVRARTRPRPTSSPSTLDPGQGDPPPQAQDWIVAFVWPKEHAKREELRALGHELAAWRSRHPLVTRIIGLEELLEGRYPPPDGPTPRVEDPDGDPVPVPRRDGTGLEFRRMSVVDPWRYCPALIYAVEGMGSTEAIESLRRDIPPELVSGIGYSFA